MSLRRLILAVCLALPAASPLLAEQTIAPAQAPAVAPTLAQAQVADERVMRLGDTLKMDELMAVMREEGLAYGRSLEDDMFPGRGGARWQAIVGVIYNTETMRRTFDLAMSRELANDPDLIAGIEAFFASGPGADAVSLEIEARRALLDDAAEDAAKVAWEDLLAKNDPRATKIQKFAEVNDLIESNVMGALNANLGFYRGMAETGAFSEEMTEEQMLLDVWGQEDAVRAETEDWLFPFLSLAYQPLTEADLDAYIDFSQTPSGRAINAALFAAFDDVFTGISVDLGRAVARQMQGEDI